MKPHSFILVTEDLKNKNIEQYFSFLVECSKHGISAVQIRNKTLNFTQLLLNKIQKLHKELLANNVTLYINDHYKIASKININAVHLGQNDESPFIVHKTLLKNPLIGYSTDNLAQIKKANSINFLSYIGVGAIFATNSKQTANIWGLEGLKQGLKQSKHDIVAIGGITEENCKSVLKTGASGIAIIADIHNAKNPFNKIKSIANTIKNLKE